MYTSIQEVVNAWVDSVNSGDLDKITALYNDAGTLVPTFSPHLFKTPGGIRNYFEQLAQRPNLSVMVHHKTLLIQPMREGIGTATGIYTFAMELDETPLTFASRFTFVIDLSQDGPIIHHHSSQVPRTLN